MNINVDETKSRHYIWIACHTFAVYIDLVANVISNALRSLLWSNHEKIQQQYSHQRFFSSIELRKSSNEKKKQKRDFVLNLCIFCAFPLEWIQLEMYMLWIVEEPHKMLLSILSKKDSKKVSEPMIFVFNGCALGEFCFFH